MPLYTFIMEYAGGTYISQVNASAPKSACLKWAQGLDVSAVRGLGGGGKETLIGHMRDETPTPVSGVLNTWCALARLRGGVALIHFVQTDDGKRVEG